MSPLSRRIFGYGLATPIVAGLVYFGFVRELAPDPEHVILQAEIKLRFASRLPPQRDDGSVVVEREALIADAVRFIDEAERLAPPSATSVEYRAYADYLRGDARAAAAGYRRASALATDGGAKHELALSAARMLALSGDDAAALAAFMAQMPTLPPRLAAGANLECARILERQGRAQDAVAAARTVLANETASAEDRVGAGEVLESSGDVAMAESVYQRALSEYPLANYFLGRLKARGGDVDNALKMLECALTDAGRTVRWLVKRDIVAWQPCAGSSRFQSLFPEMETARPGR